jgi:selenide,water dikinase
VYKLSNELALIQTIDFFTPVVDDPYLFGQIAAANSFSDVYAMGGKPLTAMNVVCFPVKAMDITVLREILKGGLNKIEEAHATLVGGHSIDDSELKYGLSVTGTIHPEHIVANGGAKPGDRLILTKPLGTGIINTAIKSKIASEKSIHMATHSMTTLNNTASEIMQAVGVNSCTDITGFGFLGHACEMAQASSVGMIIHASSVPLLYEAEEYARQGMVPAGTHRNRNFRDHQIEISPSLSPELIDILFDPQTSGGLLISVIQGRSKELLTRLQEKGIEETTIIGEITSQATGGTVCKVLD